MKEYSCYLFDADGTLIDTVELIYRCFSYTCKKFGKRKVTLQEVAHSVGMPLQAQLEFYLGPLEQSRFEKIRDAHMEYQLSIYREHLKLFPGVASTLRQLHEQGKILGVVSSRKRYTLTLYLQETGIYRYFNKLITPEDTQKHKPDPEPLLKAISLLGVTQKDTVYVGDAVFDIESGNKAGIDTAFVTWSHTDINLLNPKPTFYIDTMTDLCMPVGIRQEE